MILDILRFNKEAPRLLENDTPNTTETVGDYLSRNKYSPEFVDHYIIPMGAAIWSAGVEQMKNFPVTSFVRFFKNHGMLSVNDRPRWRVIQGGSKSYLPALTRPFKERLYLRVPVRSVKRNEKGPLLTVERNGALENLQFDHVVMAAHADQSFKLLEDATAAEREILTAFPYQENQTTLHTDTSVLPSKKSWASWNYFVPARLSEHVAVTYNMNILQTLDCSENFLVSLNMEDRIDSKKILKKMTYHHPVYNQNSIQAQARWNEISGKNRTHFCGAYWGYGFHEDGLASAQRVCESLGAKT